MSKEHAFFTNAIKIFDCLLTPTVIVILLDRRFNELTHRQAKTHQVANIQKFQLIEKENRK